MRFVEIPWQSDEYQAAINLRRELLRKPLGLEFAKADLLAESSHLHFGLMQDSKLIACLVAVCLSETHAKLRQMAVATPHQRQGLGQQLIRATEEVLSERGIQSIELNARATAIGFYEKLGYQADGTEFIEVTIPHQKMVKHIHIRSQA